jgi:hypothetical protein
MQSTASHRAVLALVAGLSIAATATAVLAQQAGLARTPNMVGEWRGQAEIVRFEDVNDQAGQPQFGQTNELVVVIGTQTGRMFATPGSQKLTGVVLPDGTVSMQMCGGNDRWFLTGTLSIAKGGAT